MWCLNNTPDAPQSRSMQSDFSSDTPNLCWHSGASNSVPCCQADPHHFTAGKSWWLLANVPRYLPSHAWPPVWAEITTARLEHTHELSLPGLNTPCPATIPNTVLHVLCHARLQQPGWTALYMSNTLLSVTISTPTPRQPRNFKHIVTRLWGSRLGGEAIQTICRGRGFHCLACCLLMQAVSTTMLMLHHSNSHSV